MERKTCNQIFIGVMLVLGTAALLLVLLPIILLVRDAGTALLRSWGVLPGIETVLRHVLQVLVLVLLITLPLSFLVTLWMFESVTGKTLRRIQRFMHGFSRVPAVLLGFVGHVLIGENQALHMSIFTMSAMLTILAVPFMVSRMDTALRAVPEDYILAGEALGARRMEILRMFVLPRALPQIMRGVLEMMERILGEATALLVLMGPMMHNNVLATELFRLAWLGRKDAAVLAFALMALMIVIRVLTMRRWRSEGGEENCRYNWW